MELTKFWIRKASTIENKVLDESLLEASIPMLKCGKA